MLDERAIVLTIFFIFFLGLITALGFFHPAESRPFVYEYETKGICGETRGGLKCCDYEKSPDGYHSFTGNCVYNSYWGNASRFGTKKEEA